MFLPVAISLGFLGSFHCVGMCGPIALAIPLKRTSSWSIFLGTLTYNLGRVLTYTIFGFLFGMLGQGFALAGLQNILSITLGSLILIAVFVPGISSRFGQSGIVRLVGATKEKLRTLFSKHSLASLLTIGILNGLLPCGLVYMGIAGSVTSGSVLDGMLFMMAFGIGTVPAMFAISVFRERISIRVRENIRKAMPILISVMAVLMILRGLNLGIPYVSPKVEIVNGTCQHHCCHK